VNTGLRIVLATRNQHKVQEISRILAEAGVAAHLVAVADFPDVDDVVETGLTFTENALLKARSVATATGLPALADDSGITVSALAGMPGVFSARWSGRSGDDDANLRLLLGQLRDIPDEHRTAAFVCVAALVLPGGEEFVEQGRVNGRIAQIPQGTLGFGYDPIFIPEGDTRTTAQMPAADKDAISHRGRAFRAIASHVALLPR
jgi:XTP/dITP diphosphohydrolase